jgi:diguanylate cyclase (GGDEF)-like protein
MDSASSIPERVENERTNIVSGWRDSRGVDGDGELHARFVEDVEELVSVFAEFLRSPESVETFSRGGEIRAAISRTARTQHELGRDAVGVIEDFRALRRCVYASVKESVDFSSLGGDEAARFFDKLLQAYDWVTEHGLEAFEGIVREQMEEDLGVAAATDLVTGLPGRDLFNRVLLPRAIDTNERFSMAIFDIVHFTGMVASGRVADARRVLYKLSESVRKVAPDEAVTVRFGDDEVCVILPGANGEAAYEVAERVLDNISAEPEGIEADVGVAEYPANARDAGKLVSEALHALNVAKRAGGGGIVVAR